MALIGLTDWMARDSGQQSTLDLANKYLLSAKIQWRGAATVTGSAIGERQNSTSWSGNGERTRAIPGITSSEEVFHRHSLYTFNASWLKATCCNRWTSAHSWSCSSQTMTHSQNTTTWRGGQTAGFKVSYADLGTNSSGTAYTQYKFRLKTKNPYVVCNGKTVTYSGVLDPGALSEWVDLIDGGDELFNSNASNTMTHYTAPYEDVRNGSSTKLEFRIMYEYLEYPQLVTNTADNIGSTSARLRGNLTYSGGADSVNLGFDYGETQAYGDVLSAGSGGIGAFNAVATSLIPITLYNFRAYAETHIYSDYHGAYWTLRTNGDNRSFETFISAPVVDTLDVTSVTSTTALLHGRILDTGGITPERFFEYGLTTAYELGSMSAGFGGIGDYSHTVESLDFDSTYYYRAYGIADGSLRGDGQQRTFQTLYPYLPAPANGSPANEYETQDRRQQFTFRLVGGTVNGATKLHARLRFSQSVDIEEQAYYVMESKNSLDGWEALIADEWVAMPLEGVDPETYVRVTPQSDLLYGPNYWDCATWDGDGWNAPHPGRYGFNYWLRVLRLRLAVSGKGYELIVDDQEWDVFDLRVSETSNGEVGVIDFTLDNEPSENLLGENQSSVETDASGFVAVAGTINRSFDYAYQGQASLKITPDVTAGIAKTTPVEVTASKTYVASLRLLSAGAPVMGGGGDPGSFRIRLYELDDTEAVLGYTESPLFTSFDGWEWLSVFRDFSADGVKAVIEIRGTKSPTLPVFYIDALQLERGEYPSPWKLGGSVVYADQIPEGGRVVLALIDTLGNSEEFVGRIRDRRPDGDVIHLSAILGDGFLGERIVRTNYPTDDVAKDITSFEPGDDGLASFTRSTPAEWVDNFADEDLMVFDEHLRLQSVVDYHYYELGAEGVGWDVGYSTGGGSQSKEADHLFIDTRNLLVDGGIKSYASAAAIELVDIHKIKVDFSVVMGAEMDKGTVRWGLGANKMDADFDMSRSRSSNLGRTVWEIDTSALLGSAFFKIVSGDAASSNIATRVYRIWGEDEYGNVIAEYEADGFIVFNPVDLSAVTDVHESKAEWESVIPSGTALTVSFGINEADDTEPASYTAGISGDPIPGIAAEADLTGKYLWVKVEFEANLTASASPRLHSLFAIVYDEGHFGVIVNCPAHGLDDEDTVFIEGDNHYNGVWKIGLVDVDTYVIDSVYEEQIGAAGTSKVIVDIGIYIKHMIETYCMPLTAIDYVNLATGFIAPLMSNGSTPVQVLEEVRLNFGLMYFVDKDYRFHLYRADEVTIPAAAFYLRRGESDELR